MIDARAHERLDVVEAAMKVHREEHLKFEAAISENTALTKKIESNTGELVTLFKGASNVRTFFVWASPIAAFFAGAWAFISWLIGRSH
jgi:hypothetical protein